MFVSVYFVQSVHVYPLQMENGVTMVNHPASRQGLHIQPQVFRQVSGTWAQSVNMDLFVEYS